MQVTELGCFDDTGNGIGAGGAFVEDGGGLKFLRERHDADFARPEHDGKAREGFEVERGGLRRLDGEVRGHEDVVERLVVGIGQLPDEIGRDEQLVNAAEPGEQRLKVPVLTKIEDCIGVEDVRIHLFGRELILVMVVVAEEGHVGVGSAGRSGIAPLAPASLDAKQTEAMSTFLAVCRDRLLPEPNKPPRTEMEQEIAELEYRLEHLRKSLEPAAVQARIPVEPERTT